MTGLSSPSIAPDGTIVVVAPGAVKTFDPVDGAELLSVERDLGPANQPAVADGSDGPIVVFTEGFGNEGPSATASPGPSPSPTEEDDEEFDSHVRAIALDTGEDVWTTPIPLEDIVQTPVTVDGSTAYVGDVGGRVTAIDVTSGEVRWTAEVGSVIPGAITVADGRALVTAFGGRNEASEVVAFNAETGEEAFRASLEEASKLVSTPVVAEDRSWSSMRSGASWRSTRRTAVRLADRGDQPDRSLGAAVRPPGRRAAAPVSADGHVFAVDLTGRAYAFDAESGALLWDHALNDPSRFSPPLLADGQLLVPTDSGTLSAIDTETGHLVGGGRRADFLRGLADAGDRIVGATGFDDGGLVAFEADPDGALLDEPSPTTFDVGAFVAGFVLGGLLLGVRSSCWLDRSSAGWRRLRCRSTTNSTRRRDRHEREGPGPATRGRTAPRAVLRDVGAADGFDAQDPHGLHPRPRGDVVEPADRRLAARLALRRVDPRRSARLPRTVRAPGPHLGADPAQHVDGPHTRPGSSGSSAAWCSSSRPRPSTPLVLAAHRHGGRRGGVRARLAGVRSVGSAPPRRFRPPRDRRRGRVRRRHPRGARRRFARAIAPDRRAGDCHWAFAYAPIIAVAEHRRFTDCLGRSVRAARMPGSGNLTFAAIYTVPVFATFLAPGVPGITPGGQPRCGCVGLRRPDEPVARRDRGSVGVSLPGGRGRGARRAEATDARSRGADRSRRRR